MQRQELVCSVILLICHFCIAAVHDGCLWIVCMRIQNSAYGYALTGALAGAFTTHQCLQTLRLILQV